VTRELNQEEEYLFNVIQALEAISNNNKWYAGINFKPNPTLEDAVIYYTTHDNGRIALEFRERVGRLRLEHKPQ